MAAADILRALLAVVIGELLGSVLPADFFARLRGVDIRATGDGNPGTINTIRVLGLAPGLITAAYDISVGIAAIQIAYLLGVTEGLAYLAGIISIVGHRFPVFRGFRGGGQGMAASAGMLVYGIGIALSRGWLTSTDIIGLLAILFVAFALTRSDVTAGIVLLPILMTRLLLAHADWQFLAFMAAILGHIWIVQVTVARGRMALRTASPAHGGRTSERP